MSRFEVFALVSEYFIPGLFAVIYYIRGFGVKKKIRIASGLCAFAVCGLLLPVLIILGAGLESTGVVILIFTVISHFSLYLLSSGGFFRASLMLLTNLNAVFWLGSVFDILRQSAELPYAFWIPVLIAASAFMYIAAKRHAVYPLRFAGENIGGVRPSFIAIPACALTGIVLTVYCFEAETLFEAFAVIAIISLIELGFALYFNVLYRSLRQVSELERSRGLEKMLMAKLESYDDYLAMAKQSRHDMRHHNAVISEYLAEGDIDGARQYLDESDRRLRLSTLREYCVNKTADAIFKVYEERAEKENVKYAVSADIPVETPLPALDLASVLSNLIENALNSCSASDFPEPYITVSVSSDDGALRLDIRNTVSGVVKFEGDYPVSSHPGGGLGTQSVKRVVTEHHGIIRFSQKEGEFTVQAVFPKL